MHPLAELQQRMRDAVVAGAADRIAPFLIGADSGRNGLAIHQRNYESSLVKALLGKFPATTWLVGPSFVTDTACRFARQSPPNAPCIAEYGENFPQFLAESATSDNVPYLRAFAELEWHVGQVSVAISHAALTIEEFSRVDPLTLSETTLTLQPGLHYLQASWPVDELMKLYLAETAPDHFFMDAADVWLEVHGSRGEFQMNRLDAAEFMFRKAVARGGMVGDAVECALNINAAFDPGRAVAALILSGLVIGEDR